MESSTRFRRATEEDKPLGELVQDLSRQTSALIREEMRLAQAELTEKGKHELAIESTQRDVETVKASAKS
jgi:hypothetical protein